MLLIGDIHGEYNKYLKILKKSKSQKSVQIGDFGMGFNVGNDNDVERRLGDLEGDHRFIRGNHDSPSRCEKSPFYIADGTVEDDIIMYIGGALSIDKDWRTPGISWWEDEELSIQKLNDMIDLCEKVKPTIMITHECPEFVASEIFSFYHGEYPSRTRQAFERMHDIHQPDLWVFGHWHSRQTKIIQQTEFVCLDELQTLEI